MVPVSLTLVMTMLMFRNYVEAVKLVRNIMPIVAIERSDTAMFREWGTEIKNKNSGQTITRYYIECHT